MHLLAKERISYLANGERCHPSSSITVQMFPVSHQKAGKPQRSSCCWICFKSILDKLMFYTLHLGSLHHFQKLVNSEETARSKIMPCLCGALALT